MSKLLAANACVHSLQTANERREMELDLQENFRVMLQILQIDPNDPNVKDTPLRLAKMYVQEVFKGRYSDMPRMTTFPNSKNIDELLIVGPITFRSCCSHHFVPFIGKAWIGIIPGDKLLGLSKFARLTEWIMARPQIQEEAIMMLADAIEEIIQPRGLAIVMKAKHFCMCWRGVKDDECEMTSSVVRGLMQDMNTKTEFLNLIKVNQ